MSTAKWDARIERAGELASTYTFASEGLRFYERLARFQKSAYRQIEAACGAAKSAGPLGTLRREFDAFLLLPQFAPFLALIAEIAPAPLAQFARELRMHSGSDWQEMLLRFWHDDSGAQADAQSFETLLSWLFLRPYAEYLADHTDFRPNGTSSTCPICSSKPQVGALRPEGDGAKRSLICSLCAREWDYGRIACAACGEEDPQKLAVYVAEEFAYVRVEACESCHRYIKTVDLTKNGHAVPVVDEIAMIPLDLWAAEHGFHSIHPNLLGI